MSEHTEPFSTRPFVYVTLVDTETTGLNPEQSEVIGIGMMCLRVSTASGKVEEVVAEAMEWQEPSAMSVEAEEVVGITKAELAGRRFNTLKLFRLFSLTDLVVAHNASFDRPFLEKCLPLLADMPWGCSFRDIDWKTTFGFEQASLDYLLAQFGRTVSGRPNDVCRELADLLDQPLPYGEGTPMKRIVEVADRVTLACSFELGHQSAGETLAPLGFIDRGDFWTVECADSPAADAVEGEVISRAVELPIFETLRMWRSDARDRFKHIE